MSALAGDGLYSKSGRFLSPMWPTHYRAAEDKRIVADCGRVYLDLSHCGAGACPLGYSNETVDAAVIKRVATGSFCMLNTPDEKQLARVMVDGTHWADKARFARTGGEAVAVAVTLARAHTGRRALMRIAGGYHGWHLASEYCVTVPNIQEAITTLERASKYLDFNQFAAVLIDASVHRNVDGLKLMCDSVGTVLIADEVSSGYRGAQFPGTIFTGDVHPHISVMAKGMSNGFPMAAVVGRGDVMAADAWLSSTYWTDGIGPRAALATWDLYSKLNVAERLFALAESARVMISDVAHSLGIEIKFSAAHTSLVRWETQNERDAYAKTYVVEEGLRRGLLVTPGSFYPMLPHTLSDVRQLADLLYDAWSTISVGDAILAGAPAETLRVR